MQEYVLYSLEGSVATITLNRPALRNALNYETVRQLTEALARAAADEAVRAVVLTGAGQAFCSGGELKELAEMHKLTPLGIKETIYGAFQQIVRLLRTMDKPAIAAINGDAVGAGFDLALACDIRIASDRARFSEYFVRIATIPGMCGMYMLPRIVGLGKAMELALTGDFLEAQEAERIGLVNKVVPHEELGAAVQQMAQKLASGPTKVMGLIKAGLNRAAAADLWSELDYAGLLQAAAMKTEDHAEGIRAAVEKRRPVYKGK